MFEHRSLRVVERTEHVVVTDAGKTGLGLRLGAGFADEHDRLAGPHHFTDVFGESSAQSDIAGVDEVSAREIVGLARVDNYCPACHAARKLGV